MEMAPNELSARRQLSRNELDDGRGQVASCNDVTFATVSSPSSIIIRMRTICTFDDGSAAPLAGSEQQPQTLLVKAEAKLTAICGREARLGPSRYATSLEFPQSDSPVQMLPVELLAKIFLDVVKVSVVLFKSSSSKLVKVTLGLSGVCSSWRQLALCTPRLWDMPMKLDVSNVSAAYAAMTKVILERSSPHPVSIMLSIAHPYKPISAALVHTIVSFILRWSSIDTLDRLTSATFNLLRGTRGPPCTLLLDAPRLSDVSLEISDMSTLPLPWSQLTSLHLTPHECSPHFLGSVGQCASLRHLFLDATGWKENNGPGVPGIATLAHLETCTLQSLEQQDTTIFTPFFAHFAFPALRDLDVRMDVDYEECHLGDAFAPFLVRCPNLNHLHIFYCDMDSEALGIILLSIPSLETLVLQCCWGSVDYEFFESLTYGETDLTPLAPRLQTIILTATAVGECYEKSILDMVLSRWWSNDTLEALSTPPRVARWREILIGPDVDEVRECSEDFESTMNELRAQGLDVDVVFDSYNY
ncbi:hypothetical protein C8F01DRAFT_1225775 [Mycena amicta]|nr:hypothetical protein C8F01DRAFT_1225775 [Mycena amicta]